jgi:glucokinase
MAGELGHITVVPNGNPCGCGNQGCLEKHASATAVSAMAAMLQLGEHPTSKEVCEIAFESGDRGERARAVWRIMGEALGVALSNLINIFNFPLYLLSGGMLPAWEFFAPHMMRVIEQRSSIYRLSRNETRIAQATLGNEAGLYGAAYLPWLEK